jgi:GMP synthase (glutamine-hydrolysing)
LRPPHRAANPEKDFRVRHDALAKDTMAKVYVLQHHPVESLGAIADALESAALAWQYVRIFDGHPVPATIKGAGGLIVMGGPMGVYQTERYPWLREEMKLIQDAIAQKRPVLGVCLGAQIVAAALGAKVDRNPAGKEIGWHPVRLEAAARDDRLMRGLPDEFTPFHWHGDIFELPSGAVSLASSEKTPCQAFRYGDDVYALQFHFEVGSENVAAMAAEWPRELEKEGIAGDRMIADCGRYLPALEAMAEQVFGRWAAPIEGT